MTGTDDTASIDSIPDRETVRETKVEDATLVVSFPTADVGDGASVTDAIAGALRDRRDLHRGWVQWVGDYGHDVAGNGDRLVVLVYDAEFTVWDAAAKTAVCPPDEAVTNALGHAAGVLKVYGFGVRESYTVERYD